MIVAALNKGVTIQDWETLTFGMILGIIVTHNNLHLGADEEGEQVRKAGQADFDRF